MGTKKIARSGRRWSRLLILAIIAYSGFVCVNLWQEHHAIGRETGTIKVRLEQLQDQNQQLKQERDQLNNPAYVEKIAREELGMAKPGEVPYIPAKGQ